MKTSSWLVSAALLICLSSSLSAEKRPAWITGADPKYPDNVYLKGVGVGKDLDTARANARAEISRTFQARIEQTVSDRQTESVQAEGKRRGPVESSQDVETRTRVSTEGLLEGVEIARTWFDKKGKKHYALAVLNKAKARAALSAAIAEEEAAFQNDLRYAREAAAPIEKARSYAQALKHGEERDRLAARRRLLDPADAPDPSGPAPLADARAAFQDTLARIQFVVEAEADPDSRLKEAVTEKISGMGFRVLKTPAAAEPAPGKPVLKVFCRLTLEPMDRGNPSWKFFQWNGSFEMSELSDGKILASSAPTGSDGHITESQARMKARQAGEEALARETQLRISQYIFGE